VNVSDTAVRIRSTATRFRRATPTTGLTALPVVGVGPGEEEQLALQRKLDAQRGYP
jgi:hypothetical protein